MAYTKEPRGLKEEEEGWEAFVVVMNARVEVPWWVIWMWRVVWGDKGRGMESCFGGVGVGGGGVGGGGGGRSWGVMSSMPFFGFYFW